MFLTTPTLSKTVTYVDQQGQPLAVDPATVTVVSDHPEFVTAALSADADQITFTKLAAGSATVTIAVGGISDGVALIAYEPVLTAIKIDP